MTKKNLHSIMLILFFCHSVCTAESSTLPLGGTVTPQGATFRVWAPHATAVSLKGDFDNGTPLPMEKENDGLFSVQVSGIHAGAHYSFAIKNGDQWLERMDPYGRQVDSSHSQSILVDPSTFVWSVPQFKKPTLSQAVIYELHVGNFNPNVSGLEGTFDSVRSKLDYLAGLGINYIELLPIEETVHRFELGYSASLPDTLEESYGAPDDLRRLVDEAHKKGIGVLIDIVHNHYSKKSALSCFDAPCGDSNGIYFYQGSHAFTQWGHPGPRPDYSNVQVRKFIEDNAMRLVDDYHVDGFRWDSVPDITQYLDYDPKTNVVSKNGVNPDGVSLMQTLNVRIHQAGALSFAEDFENNLMITRRVERGGLGFDSHWTHFAGVIHAIIEPEPKNIDIENVAKSIQDSINRVIFTESHDEVAKPPLKQRIPTLIDPNDPSSFDARKRSLLGAVLLMTSPGTPMIFQGQEFLENQDFDPQHIPLDWSKTEKFSGIVSAYEDLIALRTNKSGATSALMNGNVQFIQKNKKDKVIVFRRWDKETGNEIVVLANLGSRGFHKYESGVPTGGSWSVCFTSDDKRYSPDFGNWPEQKKITADNSRYNGQNYSLSMMLAPFSAVILCHE